MSLVVFDFDGTLTRSDTTLLLGREYDVAGEMAEPAEQASPDDGSFEQTFRQRVSLLEGMPRDQVMSAFQRCKLRDDVPELLADLRRSGMAVAVVTGSLERGIGMAFEQADVTVDHLVANRLMLENDAVTGGVDGPLLDGTKHQALEEIALSEGTPLEATLAVGDGIMDLPMLQTAGTAIGFKPDPVVEPHCDVVVTSIRKLRLYFEQHDIIDTD
ncbi:HAD family hydrolase [Natronoarchaeum sp. GCM10025321]|uniref:HAD family hydrolase n=2 Tax=unclassified Natronoarchaeum TaxID=2620183 RepID=UPI00361489DB